MIVRKTSSSVGVRNVRPRTTTPQPLSATATGLIVAGSVGDRDDDLGATGIDALDTGDSFQRSPHDVEVAVDDRDDHVGSDRALQLLRRALGDDARPVDDADAVGELVGLLEVLRREEDRHAQFRVQAPNLVPHARPTQRIESGRRLVEEQDLRVVDERGGEVEPPLHPAGVGRDPVTDGDTDVDERDEFVDTGLAFGPAQAVQAALQIEEFESGLLGVERRLLQGHADVEAHRSAWVVMSNPATVPVPVVGASSVVSIFTVVDLPAPFGPRKP